MTRKELTCVVCPAGCNIVITLDDGAKIVDITGNSCPRRRIYAENEVTHPVRTLTTTVEVTTRHGRKMLPVKTDRPLPREKLLEGMAVVRGFKTSSPVKTGDVMVADFVEEGVNLVACKDILT